MARLVGVDLPRDKRVEIALTYIFGVGRTRAQQTLEATGVSPDIRVKDLGDDDLVKLRDYLEGNYKLEGDLRREVAADIRRKVEIGSYEGLRHRRGLPVRGQRTKTNARTRKGPKRTVAGKKKAGRSAVRRSLRPRHRRPHRPRSSGVDSTCLPRAARLRAPRRCAARRRRTSPTGTLTSRARSTTRSSRSPTPPGAVIAWASAGQVGFKGSRKSTPFAAQMAAEAAARRAMEHGMRKVDVFVKGPGSGRETAIRSLTATGLEVGSSRTSRPVPHNGVPPAQAPPRLTPAAETRRTQHMARYTGADCKRCRREKIKLFLKGSQVRVPEVPDRDPAVPAGRARPRPTKENEYLLQMREKQKAARIYGVLEKQFRGYYEEAQPQPGKTGENLLRSSSRRLDNVSTAPASPSPATWPASWSGTATSWSTARRSTSRPTGCARTTSSRCGRSPPRLTPFVIARADRRRAHRAGVAEVIPSQMRVLVH